jgi:hypothetical protein
MQRSRRKDEKHSPSRPDTTALAGKRYIMSAAWRMM